jgi:hypothetical protein
LLALPSDSAATTAKKNAKGKRANAQVELVFGEKAFKTAFEVAHYINNPKREF